MSLGTVFPRMQDSADVVVVGGGVVGCGVARRLAADRDVLLLEREGLAAAASGRAAGLVAPTLFYGDHPDVARWANAFFRSFDGTGPFAFTPRHRYDFVTADGVEAARETAEKLAAQGFPVGYLDASAVEARTPAVRMADYAGAVHYGDTGWVDPYSYTTALARDAEARGARVAVGVTVTGVTADRVETTHGAVDCDDVVVAAGWRTADLVADPLPLAAYRTQCVVLEPASPLDGDFPLGRLADRHLYFRPEHNGDLLVGGRHERLADPTRASSQADASFEREVAEVVPRVLHGFETAGLVNGWAGVDAATPDARPIVDRVAGVVVATGFTGLGVMASPAAHAAVDELVTGSPAPFDRGVFSLDRFEGRDADFAVRTTSDL